MEHIPASEHDEGSTPIDDVLNGLSDTTPPAQIPHTEPVIIQPTASEPKSSEHDDNSAPFEHAVNEVTDTAQATQIPSRESAAIQSTAPEFATLGSTGICLHALESGQMIASTLSQTSDEVFALWDKSTFVRKGWLTAQEAMTYLDLYAVLKPMTLGHLADFSPGSLGT